MTWIESLEQVDQLQQPLVTRAVPCVSVTTYFVLIGYRLQQRRSLSSERILFQSNCPDRGVRELQFELEFSSVLFMRSERCSTHGIRFAHAIQKRQRGITITAGLCSTSMSTWYDGHRQSNCAKDAVACRQIQPGLHSSVASSWR